MMKNMSNTKRVIRHENDCKLFVRFIALLLLSLIASIGLIKAKNCPALMCQCKWTNGKETAFCDKRSLNAIPIGIPVSTQVLNISDNNLRRLESQVFRELGLINLQKIFLSNCKLDHLSDDSLVKLTNLIEIDLCDNQLKDIPTLSLQKCKSLRKLWLSLNPIIVIRSDSFNNLTSLVHIDLSKCQINSVELNAFRGLKQLRYLRLNSNRLTTLSANGLTGLPVLHSLDLHNNRWQCDCKLKLSIDWLLKHNVPQYIWPKCHTPSHYQGLYWNQLNAEELPCSPKFYAKTTDFSGSVGQNITIECIASGVPLPSMIWINKIRSNDNQKRYMITTERVNETFAISYMRINDLTQQDSQRISCLATNKGGAVHQNFSLVVKHLKSSQLGAKSNEHAFFAYSIFFIIFFVFGFLVSILSKMRSKMCPKSVSISSTKLSPKLTRIDILQNCKNTNVNQNENIVSNKPEISLISDIIKDTNHLKAYRFCSDTLTPDVTQFGRQSSGIANNISKSVSFETPLHIIDSTKVTYNNCLIDVSLDHFSSDNRFKYKKLNSFNKNSINVQTIGEH